MHNDKMLTVYIIGPYRAGNAWEIEQNIRRAEELALQVWKLGTAGVHCPHTNTRFFQGADDDGVWLRGEIALLSRMDAAITVPGWEQSSGSLAEVAFCQDNYIPVFHTLTELSECEWIKRYQREKARERDYDAGA